MTIEHCDVLSILKRLRLKITATRQSILDVIIHYDKPFSVKEIYQVFGDKPLVDQATVYRFVNTLLKHQILREVVIIDSHQYYEMVCIHHPVHSHFVCEKCNCIICLKKIESNLIAEFAKQIPNCQIKSANLNLIGCCNDCRKNVKKQAN